MWFCRVFPFLTFICATLASSPTCSLFSPVGIVAGFSTPAGACRYTIRYAQSQRWGYSSVATSISNQNTAALPPACPQDQGSFVDAPSQSEDCLYAVVYTPKAVTASSQLPIFVWIHGGSFTAGSAAAPGLDGSSLAINGNMIVVVLQYRLGVLGFLPPSLASSSGDPNLGMLDVINGLKAVGDYGAYIGGDPRKVVVGGQSSGAGLIRALWGAPQARGLFRGAVLQSDPMNYGFSSHSLTEELRGAFYASSPMSGCSTLACLQALSLDDLIAAQDTLAQSAPSQFLGDAFAEPIRPTFGLESLPNDPTSLLWDSPASLTFQPSNLPLLITTVHNEAGSATDGLFPSPVPLSNATFAGTLNVLVGSDRTTKLVNSGVYALTGTGDGPDGDEFRETFERLVTDGMWRCPNRDAASKWVAAGGKVWVGEWQKGVSYGDNLSGYCQKSGVVCHEDDIYPTFHTAPAPSSATSSLEAQIQSYWISFITTLNPNPSSGKKRMGEADADSPLVQRSNPTWVQYTAYSGPNGVLALGGGSAATCPGNGLWGGAVQYDFQLYG